MVAQKRKKRKKKKIGGNFVFIFEYINPKPN